MRFARGVVSKSYQSHWRIALLQIVTLCFRQDTQHQRARHQAGARTSSSMLPTQCFSNFATAEAASAALVGRGRCHDVPALPLQVSLVSIKPESRTHVLMRNCSLLMKVKNNTWMQLSVRCVYLMTTFQIHAAVGYTHSLEYARVQGARSPAGLWHPSQVCCSVTIGCDKRLCNAPFAGL